MITPDLWQRIMAAGRCAYCGAPADQLDHVVPKNERRRMGISHDDERYLVAACSTCNYRKSVFRLLPPSLAHLKPELEERSAKVWRIWSGEPLSEVLEGVR